MKDNQYTLLLVDDNSDNVELLDEVLKERGFRILTALSGQDAITLAAGQQPDLILLDIAMPVMDGLEVLNILKADEKTSKIPVIFVTGIVENNRILQAIQSGAVLDYISKPIIITELLDKIDAYFSGVAKKI